MLTSTWTGAVLGCALVALGLAAGCKTDPTQSQLGAATREPAATQWLDRVAREDLTTVALAKLGVERATDGEVALFASTVLREHARIAAEIRGLSQRTNLGLDPQVAAAIHRVADAWQQAVAADDAPEEVAAVAERVFEREGAGAPEHATASVVAADPIADVPVDLLVPGLGDARRSEIETLQRVARGPTFDKAFVAAMIADHESALALYGGDALGLDHVQIEAFASQKVPMLRRHLALAKALVREE